ncbi:MAG TPA: DUF4235 domain-containing protein [Gaiellaceae bacterium]|nr:DUF4235 domain-containing protein [Gaiellaceae bacterium]
MKTTVLRLLYRPIGLLGGTLGGLVAGLLFKRAWTLARHEPAPPNATDADRGWPEVVLAAAVQGAVFGAVKAAIDRAGATTYARATGVWPGSRSRQER